MYLSILNLIIYEIVIGKKPTWLLLQARILVPSKGQNLICTMDSALEKSLLRHLKVLRKLSRSSEGGFMEKMFDRRNPTSVAEVVFCYNPVVICWSAGVGDVILCQRKDEVLCLLEQFVISSSVPNESDIGGGTGNPDTVFCILLLCPEIAA